MDDRLASVLRVFGVQAALVSAAIHLFEGLPRLFVYLPRLSFRDPRPYLFVPSALLVVVLATLVVRGSHDRRLYSLSAGVLLTYSVGYTWWHLTDHGGLLPSHEVTDPVGEVIAHLAGDPIAFVSFAAQALGAAAFLVLFVADPRASGGDPSDGAALADRAGEE
ncbi:hypothetical protein [Halobaculum gomorrense]|uniref:Uncharacterized protein n=1 Tax=Halobaculum gomorrense TaxID=43928 RepID=A0A1M5QB67_9EURY|nr:hypothetical protein [Halobaculum gomorrense]SHH11071.1 hypothetical protein SAMN05443636_1815 [Halobaculum gomorrense]